MLRGRAGAHALVPPTDPVGLPPFIDVGDTVPLVRHALRSRANTSGFTETKTLTQPVFDLEDAVPLVRLLMVTITVPHNRQIEKLSNCLHVLNRQTNLLWLVVEDAATRTDAVSSLLANANASFDVHHHAVGPTKSFGNAQRSYALSYIRDHRLDGVVYMMDDDNRYNAKLFPELRTVRPESIGVFAIRRWSWANTQLIEMPIYTRGRFTRFQAGWCNDGWLAHKFGPRHFCVDMGAFAFDAKLLHRVRGDPWNATSFASPHGGENELLMNLVGRDYDLNRLQPLADCGTTVYVFHNEYRRRGGADELRGVCPCKRHIACRLRTGCSMRRCFVSNKTG